METKAHSQQPLVNTPIIFGLAVLGTFIGVFFLWSFLAPLESAAIASGKVTVDSNRKTIQHLEGGIVEKIHIREADKVNAGQSLITLDDTQTKATLGLLRGQANALLALEARLKSERDKKDTLIFSQELLDQSNDPKVKEIIDGHQAIFEANKASFKGQKEILLQRITQLEKEIDSLNAQVESDTKQYALIQEEVEAVAYLEKQRLIEKPRLLALKREAARLAGDKGESLGLIARAQQKIGETKTQMYHLEDRLQSEILEALRKTQEKLADILERKTAVEDILQRTVIRAPLDGVVVNLQFHTEGGVIGPGNPILDIVPSQDELVVEVRVNPLDIDIVHPGLTAKVSFSAFKQRNTPSLNGEVIHVSADSLQDQNTGEIFYLSRIIIPKDELSRLNGHQLYPGMPAQAMIITQKRTAWDYFTSPIKDSFNRAFREE